MTLDVVDIRISHGASDLGRSICRDHGKRATVPHSHRIVNGSALEKDDQGREPEPVQSIPRLLGARCPHLVVAGAIPEEEGISDKRPPFLKPTADFLMQGAVREADDPAPKADIRGVRNWL
jgi:hypothetical protein